MDGDIIVSARKRDETLHDVPLTISVVGADKIESLGLRDMKDLSAFTPGLYITPLATDRADRSKIELRFRGLSTESGAPLATLFVDGMPVSSGQTSGLDDVERVEVIKGPQSAYFGRATFSGAVNVITKKPSLTDWAGKVSGEIGSYGLHDVSASVDAPIIPGIMAIRLTARDYGTDGQYRNNAGLTATEAGTSYAQRLGAQSTRSYTAALYAEPAAGLRVRGRFNYWTDKDGPAASIQVGMEGHNCDLGGTLTYYCGKISKPANSQIGYDTAISPLVRQYLIENAMGADLPFKTSFLKSAGLERRAYQGGLSVDYDVAKDITFTAQGSYHSNEYIAITGVGRDVTKFAANPLYGTAANTPELQVWQILLENDNRDYSFESRLASTGDGPLNWLVGASYMDEESITGNSYYAPYGFIQFADGYTRTAKTRTTGLFGSLSYEILEALKLSVEGRYQWAKAISLPPTGANLEATYKRFLPRVILNYEPTDDLNFYLNYAKGNRPGSFNATIAALTAAQKEEVYRQTGASVAVKEELLTNYEAGVKARFLDGRLNLSAAVYKMKWENQGTRATAVLITPETSAGVTQVQVTSNVGASDLWGVEMEGAFRVSDALTFTGTFNIADSKVTNYNCTYCVAITGTNNVNGNRIPRNPKYAGTFAVDYKVPVYGDYDFFAHGDFVYQGRKYESELNLAYTGASKRVNLRAGVENEKIRIEAYVRNLFKDETIDNVNRYSADLLDLSNYFAHSAMAIALPEKRSIGLRASYRF
ncbi:TonB-dependent receptor [Novosphingobium sp. BL-52-GroH]|uniref:TonB-dependent receptor n=1 Tax=Novosphingobium sp. BL-52-GroH TaxID=3349877 RepID=UPI00384C5001